MVLIGKKFGRLANRLWIFSFFAANAMHHGHTLINRNFDQYNRYFEATRKNNFAPYPIRSKFSRWALFDIPAYWLMLLCIAILKKLPDENFFYRIIRAPRTEEGFDLNRTDFLQAAGSKLVVSLDGGFWFKDHKNLQRYAPELRRFFSPLPRYQKEVDQLINHCRENANVVVGVHLRKGDYRTFRNGRFYFGDNIYRQKMLELEEQFKQWNKRVSFLLCSDEPIQDASFEGLRVQKGAGHMVIDLYSMAACDFLLGPPSTFSLWASFYGKVPLQFMYPGHMDVRLDHFWVAEGINEFQRITGH
jgi:hypothetical protein